MLESWETWEAKEASLSRVKVEATTNLQTRTKSKMEELRGDISGFGHRFEAPQSGRSQGNVGKVNSTARVEANILYSTCGFSHTTTYLDD